MILGTKHCEVGELSSQIKKSILLLFTMVANANLKMVEWAILKIDTERDGSKGMIRGASDTSDIMGGYLLTWEDVYNSKNQCYV